MKEFVELTREREEHGANLLLQSELRLRLIQQRRDASPRASVAFAALSAILWLRAKVGNLFARIGPSPGKNAEFGTQQDRGTPENGAVPERLSETKTISVTPF